MTAPRRSGQGAASKEWFSEDAALYEKCEEFGSFLLEVRLYLAEYAPDFDAMRRCERLDLGDRGVCIELFVTGHFNLADLVREVGSRYDIECDVEFTVPPVLTLRCELADRTDVGLFERLRKAQVRVEAKLFRDRSLVVDLAVLLGDEPPRSFLERYLELVDPVTRSKPEVLREDRDVGVIEVGVVEHRRLQLRAVASQAFLDLDGWKKLLFDFICAHLCSSAKKT